MEDYIKEALIADFIHHSTAVEFLLVDKKDGQLRPFINYRDSWFGTPCC